MSAWQILAYAAPLLWATFVFQAIRYQRFRFLGVFIVYAELHVLTSLQWAWMPTDPHAGIRLPTWLNTVELVMRGLVTVSAIWRVGFPDAQYRSRWGISFFSGIGMALVLFAVSQLTTVGFVRILLFCGSLTFSVLWLKRPYESFDFSMVHMMLVTVMLGSAAFVSALYRTAEGHCIQGCRGGAADAVAIAVQCACLLTWIRLVGSPRFVKVKTRPLVTLSVGR